LSVLLARLLISRLAGFAWSQEILSRWSFEVGVKPLKRSTENGYVLLSSEPTV
jgi:hypothetical protein